MIKTLFTHDENGWTLLMIGHAGTAPHGQDLVCCASSMLAYTLAARMKELRQEGVARNVDISLKSGDASVAAWYTDGVDERIDEAFRTVMAGIRLLEKQHGDAISCDFSER